MPDYGYFIDPDYEPGGERPSYGLGFGKALKGAVYDSTPYQALISLEKEMQRKKAANKFSSEPDYSDLPVADPEILRPVLRKAGENLARGFRPGERVGLDIEGVSFDPNLPRAWIDRSDPNFVPSLYAPPAVSIGAGVPAITQQQALVRWAKSLPKSIQKGAIGEALEAIRTPRVKAMQRATMALPEQELGRIEDVGFSRTLQKNFLGAYDPATKSIGVSPTANAWEKALTEGGRQKLNKRALEHLTHEASHGRQHTLIPKGEETPAAFMRHIHESLKKTHYLKSGKDKTSLSSFLAENSPLELHAKKVAGFFKRAGYNEKNPIPKETYDSIYRSAMKDTFKDMKRILGPRGYENMMADFHIEQALRELNPSAVVASKLPMLSEKKAVPVLEKALRAEGKTVDDFFNYLKARKKPRQARKFSKKEIQDILNLGE